MLRAIKVRTKTHSFISDFAKLGKTEYLVAAGIGEDGSIPGHEPVQAAKFANQFVTGTEVQMIGVAKNNLRAEFFQGFVPERLDRSLCANWHEKRRVDAAMRRVQNATTRATGIATWIDC